MALAITLVPGKVFLVGELVTTDKLNQLGLPVASLQGTVSVDELAAGDYSAVLTAGAYFYGLDIGAPNGAIVTLDPAPGQYVDGMEVAVKISYANTGAATLNVNALGAQPVYKLADENLDAGDWTPGQIAIFRYRIDGDIVPDGVSYGLGGTYVLTVIPGKLYTWTKGLLDTNLVNGAQTLVATGTFIAAGTTVTLGGGASTQVTATVVPASNFWEMVSPTAVRRIDYPFQRAWPLSPGITGLVPGPPATNAILYLGSDGNWADVVSQALAAAVAAIAPNNQYSEIFKAQQFI